MDKQKQMIEEKKEIAKELDKVYPNAKFTNGWIAEVLYKLGYRKIPENAVVLTREELDKKMEPFRLEIIALSQELVETSNKYSQTRKETAEKFAQALENRLDSIDIILHEDNEEEYLSANELVELIDEICKEI